MSTPTRTTPTRTPTTPTARASTRALALAIDPVGADAFATEYWETTPLHVARREPGRFDRLLSLDDAERLVTEPGLRYPGLRLVQTGKQHGVRDYTADLPWRPVPFSHTAD